MNMLLAMVVLASAWSGFAALALSMNRYTRKNSMPESTELTDAKRRALRGLGWLALILSIVACLAWNGGALGATLWFGLATVAAITVTLVVTYWPRRLRQAALGCGSIALLGFMAYAVRAIT